MNDSTSLAAAVTALAAEKRAVGYKYDAEERVLTRFEAFCREQFPGLDTVTKASAEAWITAGRERGVRPATLQGLAAPVRELARARRSTLVSARRRASRTWPASSRIWPAACLVPTSRDLAEARADRLRPKTPRRTGSS